MKREKVTFDIAEDYFLSEWMSEQQEWAWWNIHHRAIKKTRAIRECEVSGKES